MCVCVCVCVEGGEGGVLNGQNLLSVTNVICQQSLTLFCVWSPVTCLYPTIFFWPNARGNERRERSLIATKKIIATWCWYKMNDLKIV